MTKTTEIRIGELSVAHLTEIVAVHVQSFPRSATTRLGPDAVRRYYEWQFLAPHQAHFIGAWVDDQLGGFCICGKFRSAMGGFLARNKWFLARQVLMRPWLLMNPEVRSASVTGIRRLFKPSAPALPPVAQPDSLPRFGILATAVAPRCRRLGLGARVMQEAERIAHGLGFEAMGLTVNPANEPALCFYKRLGWTPVSDGDHWQGRMEKPLRKE